jgi:intein-encoded DNA endonuclease-like protein
MKELSDLLNISERSVSRVLIDNNINTRLKNRYTLNEDYFSVIDSEEKAYILGFLYADGYVDNDNYIVFSLTERDGYMVQLIADKIEFTGEVKTYQKGGSYENSKPKCVLSFSSEKMASDLRAIGLYPNKSTSMENIPKIEERLYRHFVRGYFDGDGSITTSLHSSCHIVRGKTKVYQYPMHVMTMISTLAFLKNMVSKMPITLYSYTQSKSNKMFYFRCQANKEIPVLFKYLYDDSTMYLKRKFNKWVKILGAIEE